MPEPTILVATWDDGLFSVGGGRVLQELAGRPVRGLASDGRGSVLAIVGGHALYRRSGDGRWAQIAASEQELSCCVAVGETVFLGTDDAQILRLDPGGAPRRLTGFDAVEGRGQWYAGAAMVEGRLMGPPLGVRSLAATCDGGALLANVHVGGVPRSTDGGLTWRPTLDIECDVHQVCAHPSRPEIVIAASAAGLCVSGDGGATWRIEQAGLHARHCSAVAFGRRDLFISAASDQFAAEAAVYRRPIDGEGALQPVGGGLPRWIEGVADTDCIAARGSTLAVIDRSGRLYRSHDDGGTWASPVDPLPCASGIHILETSPQSG
jgi:hypothetical protein